MSASEWAVVLLGSAAIVWINWYFFLAGKASAGAAPGADGVQEATITDDTREG